MMLPLVVSLLIAVLASGVIPSSTDEADRNFERMNTIISNYFAAIAAAAAAGGLYYSGKSIKQQLKTDYVKTLKEYAEEIYKLEQSEERNNNRDVFAVKYLNKLDQIAYLALKKIIPKEIAMYFEEHFSAGLALLKENDYVIERKEIWENLTTFCQQNNIKASTPP